MIFEKRFLFGSKGLSSDITVWIAEINASIISNLISWSRNLNIWSFIDSGSTPILGRTSLGGWLSRIECALFKSGECFRNVELLRWDIMRWVFGDHMPLIHGKGQTLHSNYSFPTKGVLALTCRSWKMHAFQNTDFLDLMFWFDLIFKNIFFEKCVQDCNKPKPTEMGEGFVEIMLGWMTRSNLGSNVFDGWHSKYPEAFAKIHLGDEGLHLAKRP